MSYTALEDIFNFEEFYYEVLFEEVNTNFWERLFTRKETKNVYYIRQVHKIYPKDITLLCEDKTPGSLGYSFENNCRRYWTILYFDNPNDPQNLLTKMKYRNELKSDNVIFSSKNLHK